MSTCIDQPQALGGVSVVDMSGPMGNYCGKLLADLGADVILVELPDGAALRHRPPFVPGFEDDQQSAAFLYCNSGKHSFTADLEIEEDRSILADLIAGADVVIETEAPGALAMRKLGWEELAVRNPRLVMTSITPFGQTGPYASFAACDIVCLALGGLLSLTGYADVSMQICAEQSYLMGSTYAAVASMMALLYAEQTGQGQHVDVSLQACVATALENAPQFFDLEGIVRGRPNGTQRHAGTGIYRCANGYVYLYVGGIAANRFWDRMVGWLTEAGVAAAAQLADERWSEHSYLETDEAKATFAEIFEGFAAPKSKLELYESAQAKGIPLCPVNGVEDIVASDQLKARGFFESVSGPDGVEHSWPGAPYRLSLTPWRLGDPASVLGEHDDEIRRSSKLDGHG